jgi:hypothetical protein
LLLFITALACQTAFAFEQTIEGGSDPELGSITYIADRELVAGGTVSITASYVTGVDWMPGSAISFSEHWLQRSGLQTSSSEADGYVNLVTRIEGVQFEIGEVTREGVHGGLDSIVSVPVFRVTEGLIPAGTTLAFAIGNLTLPKIALQQFALAAYIRRNESAPFTLLTGNSLLVQAGRLERLSLRADSLAQPGEEVGLWLRLEDQFGNLAADRTVSLDLLVNGTFRNRLSVQSAVQVIRGVKFDLPGVYRIDIRSGGGGLKTTSNPILVSNRQEQILWANIGAHSNRSDGSQTFDELLDRQQGRYDLTVPADHEFDPTQQGDVVAIHDDKDSVIRFANPDGRQISAALAESPTVLKYQNPDELRLTQIVSDDSVYIWMGESVASRGYETGFIAIDHSHQYPGGSTETFTGIITLPGQTWFDALAAGQTYVSVGEMITLLVDHRALATTEVRVPGVEVIAGSPIEYIALIKNGTVIASRSEPDDSGQLFTLSVSSSSEPYSGLNSQPRNGREWIGYVATRDSPVQVAPGAGWLTRQSSHQRIDFLTRTHGDSRRLNLTLTEPTADTVLEIGLAAVVEDAAWIPVDRLPQKIAAQRFLIPLGEMQQGAVRSFGVAGYNDRLEVTPSLVAGETQTKFSYADSTSPRIGDYYYFFVRLTSGAFAYSSPVFVELNSIGISNKFQNR